LFTSTIRTILKPEIQSRESGS